MMDVTLIKLTFVVLYMDWTCAFTPFAFAAVTNST